jgi:PAS domain S-box-containing protein
LFPCIIQNQPRTASYMPRQLSLNTYLAAVLKYAQDGIVCIDNHCEIVCWNPAAERLFGYSQTQATGSHLDIIVPPTSHAELSAMMVEVGSSHQIARRELTCRRSDGSLLQIEMTMGTVWDRRRKIGVVVIARDITERKSAEKALRATPSGWRLPAVLLPRSRTRSTTPWSRSRTCSICWKTTERWTKLRVNMSA